MKCDEDILKVFYLTKHKIYYFLFQRAISPKLGNPELWFFCSACHVCLKFSEDCLNGFSCRGRGLGGGGGGGTIRSQNLLFSVSTGHNSKNKQSRVTVLAFCISSNVG